MVPASASGRRVDECADRRDRGVPSTTSTRDGSPPFTRGRSVRKLRVMDDPDHRSATSGPSGHDRRPSGRRQSDRARGGARPHRTAPGPPGRRGGGRLRRSDPRGPDLRPARAGDRHPHAPLVQPGGHRRRQGGAAPPSGHRRRHPLAVRRSRVRRLPAGRRLGRLRVPPEGPHRRGQPAGRRHPGGGHRRHGARSRPSSRRCCGRLPPMAG